MTADGRVDWELLQQTVGESTRFLDNVVDANAYVPAVPELREAALRARRIGLGIMGLGDLMYEMGVRYGSHEGQALAGAVMEFVRYHCMQTSIQLAAERGSFPAIIGSLYDPDDLQWTAPQPLATTEQNWDRPALDWRELTRKLRKHGIRNAAQTTVAPTGTIATVSGCEGYGCEPVFALAYLRHVNDAGKDLTLHYTSPLFERALLRAGIDEASRQAIVDEVIRVGSCQHIEEAPRHIRDTFVVAADITPEEHIRMQAAIQAFVDNSISKTCNFPASATPEDVADAYLMAWDLKCKGLTVYVTGSREKVVLETRATRQAKEKKLEQPTLWRETKKPRAKMLRGETHRITTPLGTTYITINENGDEEPFEVFLHASKAGSETNAVSEAIGRLISYTLRLSSPVPPRDRLKEVVKQLGGIGGGRPLGFGANRVLSLPDGIAQALEMYLDKDLPDTRTNGQGPLLDARLKFGDLCPECGEAALVNEEGCQKCYACGHSEC
jgi:ribonucleoside-diphosphate reductase alpha chain